MTEAEVLLVLVGCSGLVAVFLHTVLRRWITAVVGTAFVISAGVQVYLAAQGAEPWKDKFFGILLLYPAIVGFATAAIVGIPFARRRAPWSLVERSGPSKSQEELPAEAAER